MSTFSRGILESRAATAMPRGLLLLLILLVACGRQDRQGQRAVMHELQDLSPPTAVALKSTNSSQSAATANSSATPVSAIPEIAVTATATDTAVIRLTSTQGAAATATAIATASATPNPYAGLSVEELSERGYGGGELDIVETMKVGEAFTRYLITYPSDGLTIYGFMNVPNEGTKFPVAIVLHGYIPPSDYQTVSYTERYANALAEAGYFVIHPNLRNYPPSDSGPDPYRTGFATDVLNLIAIVREQSQDPQGYLRRVDRDDINLFGHSMGGGVALRVVAVNNDPYLRAAVLYAAMSGDESLNYERIKSWSNGNAGEFELAASAETLKAISPISHLERIQAAISVHHSLADTVVPPEWSADLCNRLERLEIESECFTYEGLPHTFRGSGDGLFINRVIDFFNRH